MATSERKAEIARTNGRKSRGPTTPHGKLMSSINAFKHGLDSGSPAVMLLTDDAREYQQFVDGLTARYEPQSPVETHLVQTAAMAMIRQQRLWAVDAALTNSDILMAQKQALFPDRVIPPSKDPYAPATRATSEPYREGIESAHHELSKAIKRIKEAIASPPDRDVDVWSRDDAEAGEDTWLAEVEGAFGAFYLEFPDTPWYPKVEAFCDWLYPWACYADLEEDESAEVGPPPTARQVVSRVKKILKDLEAHHRELETALNRYDEVDKAIESAIAQSKVVISAINHERFDLLDRYQRCINRDLYASLDRLEAIRQSRINEKSMIPLGSFRQNDAPTVVDVASN